jgi:hypothetical protein
MWCTSKEAMTATITVAAAAAVAVAILVRAFPLDCGLSSRLSRITFRYLLMTTTTTTVTSWALPARDRNDSLIC